MGINKTYFSEMHMSEGPRAPYTGYEAWFANQNNARLATKAQEAEAFFRRTGITFNVYGQQDAEERLIPFDLVPRIMSGAGMDQAVEGHRSAGTRDQRVSARHL